MTHTAVGPCPSVGAGLTLGVRSPLGELSHYGFCECLGSFAVTLPLSRMEALLGGFTTTHSGVPKGRVLYTVGVPQMEEAL